MFGFFWLYQALCSPIEDQLCGSGLPKSLYMHRELILFANCASAIADLGSETYPIRSYHDACNINSNSLLPRHAQAHALGQAHAMGPPMQAFGD